MLDQFVRVAHRTLPDLLLKALTQEQPDGRGAEGQVLGHGAPQPPRVHPPRALPTPSFGVFMVAS